MRWTGGVGEKRDSELSEGKKVKAIGARRKRIRQYNSRAATLTG